MSIRDGLRAFLVDDLNARIPHETLTDTYTLIEHRVVDSVGIYQLVLFIETEFGVEVLDEELVLENFATINDIARLIESKRGL